MMTFLITALITTISLVIISHLPLGIEIDGFNKALIAGLVFGVLNAIVAPILLTLALPVTILTLGLAYGLVRFIVNVIIFALAAQLVEGFRLKNGIWSAALGALILSLSNSIIGNLINNLL
ncbi:phage holin family protein [Spirulina major]|uniref:phage holin family protein n=1 Tax=Spirulina major TaxID=270636 RepID=UPI001C3198A5|nr:phage holin family protein [Spirulina major]